MPCIRDDRGGHTDAHQNNLALWWLIIFPACLQMLWPCTVESMFHSLSGLSLICVAPFFLFLFYFGGRVLDGFAFTLPSGLNNHLIHVSQTSPYWLICLSPLLSSPHRPSTKTIWFWRKEISTSTHSLPGRPIPTHTSPTSTPMMTISPQHVPYHRIWLYSFLCALYWDSSHHAWDKPTLRLYGSWYVIKYRHTVLPTEGNPHFLSGALRYTWKAQYLGVYLALTLTEK